MENEQRQDNQECDFISRVTLLPVVRAAMDTTVGAYQKAKEMNGLVNFTLSNAEKTAYFAAGKAKPMVDRFETQIGFVDVLACRTLDKLEKTVPIIKKTPEEIYGESKRMYEEIVVKPALTRYNNIKDYGVGKALALKDFGVAKATTLANTTYGQMVTGKVDEILIKADGYVDNYLPCQFEGGQEADIKLDVTGNTIEKMTVLSRKLRQRVYCHGLVQIKAAKKKSDEILSNLQITVELINNIKSNLNEKNKMIKEHVAQAQARVLKLWEELDSKYSSEESQKSTLEQKLFFVAKQLTTQLHNNYQKIASTLKLFPTRFQPSVQMVQDYIANVYGQFKQAKSWDEVSSVFLAQLQDAVRNLQSLYSDLYDSALQTKALSWMVGPKRPSLPVPRNEQSNDEQQFNNENNENNEHNHDHHHEHHHEHHY